jgi:SH3-like domain-containing protein
MGIVFALLGVLLVAGAGAAAFVIIRQRQAQDADLPPPEIGELVDYTSLPEEEPQTWQDRLRNLSLPAKILIGVVPLLLIGLLAIAVISMMLPAGQPAQPGQPTPQPANIAISRAGLVNATTINVRADTNLPDGTTINVQLLEDGEPVSWFGPDEAEAAVERGSLNIRLNRRGEDSDLQRDAEHTIVLTAEHNGEMVEASSELEVPSRFADDVFAPSEAAAAPPTSTSAATEPTSAAEEEETPRPSPTTRPTQQATTGVQVTVGNGGRVRAQPTVQSSIVGEVVLGDTVEVLYRERAGSSWYRIRTEQGLEGWSHNAVLLLNSSTIGRIPVQGAAGAVAPTAPRATPSFDLTTGLLASVSNGGNVRSAPNLSATVLDQVHASETVELLGKTRSGVWYQVKNMREQVGWVHYTLLSVPADVAEQVPVQG